MPSQRSFPAGSAYAEALQNTTRCFKDAQLRGGVVATTKLGLPRPISGNFASVFDVTSPGGARYAVKCFTRDVPEQRRRYEEISRCLGSLRAPWSVGFTFLDEGVRVRGEWYPALRMEWVEAVGLIPWIERHLADRDALALLAEHFAEVVFDLADAGYAHGDLQHGNLLVTAVGEIKLIDYDGMYVPALAALGPSELGHRNYQPPNRRALSYGPDLDRFSAWVIYLSLRALAADPALWTRLRPPGGECLLLNADDYLDLGASYRMRALLDADPALRAVADQFLGAVGGGAAPPALRPAPAVGAARPAGPPPTGPLPNGAPPGGFRAGTGVGGRPSWLPPPAGRAASAPPPLTPQPPPPLAPTTFGRPSRSARVIGRGGALLALASAVCLLVPNAASSAVAGLVVCVAATLAGLWPCYRHTSAVRARRQARRDLRRQRRRRRQAARALASAERRRGQVEARATSAAARAASLRKALDDRVARDIAASDDAANRELAGVARRRSELANARAGRIAAELRQVRQRHIDAELVRLRVADARIKGIGPALVAALAAQGIETAYDFHGLSYRSGAPGQGTSAAWFVRRVGPPVRVAGIGDVKARRVDGWRAQAVAQAERGAPQRLPLTVEHALDAELARETADLAAREQVIRAASRKRRQHVADQAAAERAALAAQRRADEIATERDRALAAQAVANGMAEVAAAVTALAHAAQARQACRGVRFRRYVRLAILR